MKKQPFRSSHAQRSHGMGGSAIIAVLSLIGLLTILLVCLLQNVRIERSSSAASSAEEQAQLSAESGIASAQELLMIATSNRPAYLVGLPQDKDHAQEQEEHLPEELAPPLLLGASNLISSNQILPLFSFDLKQATSFPKLTNGTLESLLEERYSTNPSVAVDLNDPSLVGTSLDTNTTQGTNQPTPRSPGMIAAEGRYPALWQSLHDSEGKVVGHYAFVMTDESARLNPALHLGNPRTDSTNWDHGPGDLPLSTGMSDLPDAQEAAELRHVAEVLPTEGSFETAFSSPEEYQQKRSLLTRDPCRTPDLIPATLPEGGLPKYNLNDLATNPAWGSTPYDRATNIARIIDKNLPKFKQRDPSLAKKGSDPFLYLTRLACSIVDYISNTSGSTGASEGEPSGRDLVPYVTKIAEKCTRTAFITNSATNSTTIESQFFVEVWNPTTGVVKGGTPRLVIGNRAYVLFGTAKETPFAKYDETASQTKNLHPNEFIVLTFKPESQTWNSLTPPGSKEPGWKNSPAGNENNKNEYFEFYWNGKLVDMSRRPPLSPAGTEGGLKHLEQALTDSKPHWQCLTVPTYSGRKTEPAESSEALDPGSYRFVGDPRATFLTSYNWVPLTTYQENTLWNGVVPGGVLNKGMILDPKNIWKSRDWIPENPVVGNRPSGLEQMPDQIPSSYREGIDGKTAPFVTRKGSMVSLAELGNIFEPAQIDDQGTAVNPSQPGVLTCSGGGRTLRIGQPEFQFAGTNNWDLPGKRAIELLDLFTVADDGRHPPSKDTSTDTNQLGTNAGIPGRINVNTAPHAVLTSLFYGIGVTSDQRSTNSRIDAHAADNLATSIETNRPYQRLSDLYPLTTNLVNAQTYTPVLFGNIRGSSPPAADAFDRAREEAFGKMIGHCILQTRVFHLYVIGESLDNHGKSRGRSLMEGLLRLEPDAKGRLIPSLHDVQWR
jgi:hypothetical protein